MGDVTRWTVNVALETDIEVRTYLAQRGMKKGDLSRFIEEAVKWRLFDLTLAEARAGFDDLPADEPDSLIEEAVADAQKAARTGPVFITNRGRPAHVLLSYEEYRRITGGRRNLVEALAAPGLADIEVEFPRSRDLPRPADLS